MLVNLSCQTSKLSPKVNDPYLTESSSAPLHKPLILIQSPISISASNGRECKHDSMATNTIIYFDMTQTKVTLSIFTTLSKVVCQN